jgi:hypothetical protein
MMVSPRGDNTKKFEIMASLSFLCYGILIVWLACWGSQNANASLALGSPGRYGIWIQRVEYRNGSTGGGVCLSVCRMTGVRILAVSFVVETPSESATYQSYQILRGQDRFSTPPKSWSFPSHHVSLIISTARFLRLRCYGPRDRHWTRRRVRSPCLGPVGLHSSMKWESLGRQETKEQGRVRREELFSTCSVSFFALLRFPGHDR